MTGVCFLLIILKEGESRELAMALYLVLGSNPFSKGLAGVRGRVLKKHSFLLNNFVVQ
jgi:hypothetical protein